MGDTPGRQVLAVDRVPDRVGWQHVEEKSTDQDQQSKHGIGPETLLESPMSSTVDEIQSGGRQSHSHRHAEVHEQVRPPEEILTKRNTILPMPDLIPERTDSHA